MSDLADGAAEYTEHPGAAPTEPPAAAQVWTEQAAGRGTQTIVWPAQDGRWTIVAMNADGSARVTVKADIDATVPSLPWISAGVLAGGAVVLAAGSLLIFVPVRRASR